MATYPQEFKDQIVGLHRQGRSNWRAIAPRDRGVQMPGEAVLGFDGGEYCTLHPGAPPQLSARAGRPASGNASHPQPNKTHE